MKRKIFQLRGKSNLPGLWVVGGEPDLSRCSVFPWDRSDRQVAEKASPSVSRCTVWMRSEELESFDYAVYISSGSAQSQFEIAAAAALGKCVRILQNMELRQKCGGHILSMLCRKEDQGNVDSSIYY